MGPSSNPYPPAPAPEVAWCEPIAWVLAGVFAAMFVTWIVLALLDGLRVRRARRARPPVTRFVVAGVAEAPEVRQS